VKLPSRTVRLCCAAAALLVAAAAPPAARAQVAPPDTAAVISAPAGQPAPATPPAAPAGPAARQPGDGDGLEHPINFAARDSLVIIFAAPDDPAGDVGTLYGDARTDYDDARLTAHEIDLLFQREILRARGMPGDTLVDGRPAFQRGDQGFTGRELAYHLGTQRGRVVGARTTIEDGYVLGGAVTQVGANLTYAQDVIYTTCEYEEHNHWGLHTHRMKVVDGEWIYTSAARLHILGIPTPIWLPFGFFPAADGRRSGPLPPDYGEQSDLGFFVRNLGYYWALSEYFDAQLAGGVFTSGSWEGQGTFRYARRYWYDGGLTLGYRLERRGEPQDPDYATQRQASISWRHNQTLDAAGTARLSGNVDLRTAGYARGIAADYDQRTSQSTTSNLNFTKRWRSGRQVQASYRQTLDLTQGSTRITLPTLSFNQPRWFPFRGAGGRGTRWFEQIGVQYSATAENVYNFVPQDGVEGITWIDGLLSFESYREATGNDVRFDTRATHRVPVSGNFTLRNIPLTGGMQLDLTPSLSYNEDWYSTRREIRTDAAGFAVRDTLGNLQFDNVTAFTPIRQANFTLGASTRFFGTFPWRIGALDGFRHEVRPTVSLSYAPDYSASDFWGQRRQLREPDGTVIDYPVRQGVSLDGRPQQAIDISIANVLQTRLAREDTTGAIQRRAIQLMNFTVRGGYDIARDSLNWRDVSLNARSTIADQVTLNFSAVYSPYQVDSEGNLQNRFHFSETGRPFRFLRANFSASTQLRGSRTGGAPEIGAPLRRPPTHGDLDFYGDDGLAPYDYRRPDLGFVDFSIPWSLSLDFNYGINRNFRGGEDSRFATLNSSFDLGITRDWRINGRTGFDFDSMDFVPTQISIMRDLHCWEMSLSWVPFGQFQAISFSIYVKSGHLRDLLRLDVPNVDRSRVF
jgi:hypothetical protein